MFCKAYRVMTDLWSAIIDYCTTDSVNREHNVTIVGTTFATVELIN